MNNHQPDYNYLDLLNPQQREAVVYKDGPALVIAGAGSGKTRVLTYKIVDLIRSGYEPYRIMALTFTNKAAREMRDRITQLVGEKVASRLWMGTFHSIFLRILRRHSEMLGFKSNFTIYDAADSKSLIKTIIKDFALDEKQYKASTVAAIISNAKNALISPEDYRKDRATMEADARSHRPRIADVYATYCSRCRASQAMDFDDILVYMNILLRDFPDIRRHYQDFFRYVLVDEYQDTNFSQHLIVRMLTEEHDNICVVGDDAQSIYSFRGASIGNILNLTKTFPNLKTFKLERNYRSTQNIVNAAGSLIAKNRRQIPKNVFSENDKGEKVKVVRTVSDIEEAATIVNLITESKLRHHDSESDYAILYRTNAQSRVFEEKLRSRNIPYRIYGGLSFYQRKEVKDAISYFRLSVNPDDDEALRRVINYPARGIGETTLKKLRAAALNNQCSLWHVLTHLDTIQIDINRGTLGKLQSFAALIKYFVELASGQATAYEVGQTVYNRTGMLVQLMSDKAPETISKQENLKELLTGLNEFVNRRQAQGEDASMQDFLSEVSLATDQDVQEETPGPKVTLMTVHAAKGLEFKHIYVVGVEEELFPSAMALSEGNIEEERRLMYVAITRAMETCTLSYSSSRFRNGQTIMSSPSRFLSEISKEYLDVQSSAVMGGPFVDPVRNYRESNRSFGGYGRGYGSRNDYGKRNDYSDRYEPSRMPSESTYSGSGINDTKEIPLDPKATSRASQSLAAFRKKNATATLNGVQYLHLDPKNVKEGMRVGHQLFGEGTVVRKETEGFDIYVVIDFGKEGEKRMMLKFAKLAVLG